MSGSTSWIRFAGAFLCIGLAVTTWVVMAVTLQGLFKSYPQSYFMVYWIHSWYAVMYVAWKTWREFPGNLKCNRAGDGSLTWKRALWSSAVVSVTSLLSAYFWYLSLPQTSVPANVAIYQSAVAFTFILSVPLLRESVTVVKILAVSFSITGVALVSVYSERDKSGPVHQSVLGYVYLVTSTILYALMEVLFKKLASFKDDPASGYNGMRMVGLMGIHTVLWMWPPLIVLHYSNVEPFHWPSKDILYQILYNTVLDVTFNASLFICVALSSPLFATVGTVTAIPASVIVDYIRNRRSSFPLVYVGMMMIIVGFTGFVLSEFMHIKRDKREADKIARDNISIASDYYSADDKYASINAIPSNETDSLLEKRVNWRNNVFKYIL
ncbi:PREDICTED: uncharacterized transporter C405.03c-like [Amphimedon queenslandica]|uniref:Uncharacterized protein n=1 Tax=Amphimedon queenslandica TaxID=400682 RepID=A0A1X7V0J9_AMPQE|nr:PREDICTED: uncharacterized transporter C405.03c-like [Amphimedon queenslandica]|eukprot:XP_019851351.1 PREDICTED: uncharacterized transporter C405.03c-like [Amphimedon queenslandica]